MFRDLKPRILSGKSGLLSLPSNVDFRRGARCVAAAGEESVSVPLTGLPLRESHLARRRSLFPLIAFCAAVWVGLIVAVFA